MRYLELHAIQTYPAGLPNRDANNQTKTLTYGNVLRARISSQALRRPQRIHLRESLAPELLGMRTRALPRLISDELVSRGVDPTAADTAGRYAMALAGLKLNDKNAGETAVLLFVAQASVPTIAELVSSPDVLAAGTAWDIARVAALGAKKNGKKTKDVDGDGSDEAGTVSADAPVPSDKTLAASVLAALDPVGVADIALFGRMLAEVANGQVHGALQVAHAFSVEPFNAEPDFFVAVDDKRLSSDPGSGMLGYIDVGSHTMYRWACVDLQQLRTNLGPDVDLDAVVRAYVSAFCLANPSAKTTGSGTAASLPMWVTAALTNRPVNLADVFISPINAAEGAVDLVATQRLATRWAKLRHGSLAAEARTWTVADGACVPAGAQAVNSFEALYGEFPGQS